MVNVSGTNEGKARHFSMRIVTTVKPRDVKNPYGMYRVIEEFFDENGRKVHEVLSNTKRKNLNRIFNGRRFVCIENVYKYAEEVESGNGRCPRCYIDLRVDEKRMICDTCGYEEFSKERKRLNGITV